MLPIEDDDTGSNKPPLKSPASKVGEALLGGRPDLGHPKGDDNTPLKDSAGEAPQAVVLPPDRNKGDGIDCVASGGRFLLVDPNDSSRLIGSRLAFEPVSDNVIEPVCQKPSVISPEFNLVWPRLSRLGAGVNIPPSLS